MTTLTIEEESLTPKEWGERTGIHPETIRTRKRRGWGDVDAVYTPVHKEQLLTHNGQTLSYQEWEEVTGLPKALISKRLHRGWSMERALETPVNAKSPKYEYLVYILRATDGSDYVGIAYHDGMTPEEGLRQRYAHRDRWNRTRTGRKASMWRLAHGGFDQLEKIIAASRLTKKEAVELESFLIRVKSSKTPLANTQHLPEHACPLVIGSN